MASVKRGDTWPPLRGAASDEDGLLDMTSAEKVLVIFKHSTGTPLIYGTIWSGGSAFHGDIIAPPGDSDGFNWTYTWRALDTAITGNYSTELEITWDTGTTPAQVETVPNGDNPTLTVFQDNG